jgi:hypothetical protein
MCPAAPVTAMRIGSFILILLIQVKSIKTIANMNPIDGKSIRPAFLANRHHSPRGLKRHAYFAALLSTNS